MKQKCDYDSSLGLLLREEIAGMPHVHKLTLPKNYKSCCSSYNVRCILVTDLMGVRSLQQLQGEMPSCSHIARRWIISGSSWYSSADTHICNRRSISV